MSVRTSYFKLEVCRQHQSIISVEIFFLDQKVNLCVTLKFLQRKWEDYKAYLFKLDLALGACCLPTTLQTLID